MTYSTSWQLENLQRGQRIGVGGKIYQFYKYISKFSFQKMVNKRMDLENSSYILVSRKLSNGAPHNYIFLVEIFPSPSCLRVQGN